MLASTASHLTLTAIAHNDDILGAFINACAEIKAPKLVQLSVACMHKLIDNGAVAPVRH